MPGIDFGGGSGGGGGSFVQVPDLSYQSQTATGASDSPLAIPRSWTRKFVDFQRQTSGSTVFYLRFDNEIFGTGDYGWLICTDYNTTVTQGTPNPDVRITPGTDVTLHMEGRNLTGVRWERSGAARCMAIHWVTAIRDSHTHVFLSGGEGYAT